MNTSLPDYQYQALSTFDSVRLLSISRDDNHPHGLWLSLKEVNLDDEPIFAALSYTWQLPKYSNSEGAEEPGPGRTFEIVCDGRLMEISENLFDFLRTILDFRCSSTERGSPTSRKCPPKVRSALESMPLWIDAFCIDQANTEEKKHQVLLMHRIYSSSQNVLWIHDKFIPRLSKMFFRQNRWFDRGWVVQEVALANSAQIYVMCGGNVLNWKRLGAFVMFLHEIRWNRTLELQLELSLGWVQPASMTNSLDMAQSLISRHLGVGSGLHKINRVRPLLAELIHNTETTGWNTRSESAWLACARVLITALRSFQFGDDRDHIHGGFQALSCPTTTGAWKTSLPL
ncbi:hypothetical protein BDP81DRAFT_456686 [Colletotrichum phormii]|uniref:Heterokaryon incompatibility domain-containing protein n=1 Tax=Colletotrichum phormii TaxID=359342 RepID=A0AAJ0ENS2_9PEZI|nr:uncharacterized protein BDP81DRAFT_456686 [Colletotrichum phormii]KAK1655879.1 hypothetical protein BDP81DRAFT_456686 [Colletotrichum phormii]